MGHPEEIPWGLPLSVEGQVYQQIQEATSAENLSQVAIITQSFAILMLTIRVDVYRMGAMVVNIVYTCRIHTRYYNMLFLLASQSCSVPLHRFIADLA